MESFYPKTMKTTLYSCVVDNKPKFRAQSFILIQSLLSNGVQPQNIFIHLININSKKYISWLNDLGVNVRHVEIFLTNHVYCNKLSQLATFESLERDWDQVVLLDCDIAVISLDGLNIEEDVAAKLVDLPNPPYSILKSLFQKAQLAIGAPVNTTIQTDENHITDQYNCNGGVYIIRKNSFDAVVSEWKSFALWCADNVELFTSKYVKHIDQVSFAMALNKLDLTFRHLDIEDNYPLHLSQELLPNISPRIIHYHDLLDDHFKISKIGLSEVDEAISILEESITASLNSDLQNSIFWDFRYATNPSLGSGVGSRGEILQYKKKLLHYSLNPIMFNDILDVGCGDLELMKDQNYTNYFGLDVSEEAIGLSKIKRPDWTFSNSSIEDDSISKHEAITCFDVLIHQSRESDFYSIVKSIFEKANKRVIIAAYNSIPEYSSNITHYYEGIFKLFIESGSFKEVAIVGKYRDVTVVVGSKVNYKHKRDIGSQQLNIAFGEVDRADLLLYLVDVSRKHFGFFTSHYPRVFEYSWLLEQLENQNPGAVIDLGAGVCPLPLCLDDLGWTVTTIDLHNIKRDIQKKESWNEWGFLDYSLFSPHIKSYNKDFSKYVSLKRYDVVYSISVIEHMPQKTRVAILKKASKLLKKNGLLLMTIDLIPNTEQLWNLSEDKEVEDAHIHGTVDSFTKELTDVGFELVSLLIQRNIKDSRTDICYIKARLVNKGFSLFNFNRS